MKHLTEHVAVAEEKREAEQVSPVQDRECWPLTPAEQGMLVEHQLEPDSLAYNAGLALELQGVVDVPLLEKSLVQMVQRHRNLRSFYPFRDGEFTHCIAPEVKTVLTRVRCAREEIQQKMDERNVPFDLANAPLFRFVLYETKDASVLHIFFHHVILDGFSMAVFADELWKIYQKEELAPARPDYLDLAVHLQARDYTAQEAFFDEMFADGVPETEMPTRPIRPEILPYVDAEIGITLCPDTIEATAHKLGITTYSLLFAAIGIVLGKYCGGADVVLGAAMSGRVHSASRGMLGMFVNSLPVRLKPAADKTFEEYALAVAQTLNGVKRNQDYPLEQLISRFAPERNTARAPLFDVIVNYLHELPTQQIGALHVSPFLTRRQALAYDFQIEIRRNGAELTIDLSYAKALYVDEVPLHFLEQLQTTLARVCENPSMRLIDAAELPERQALQILNDFAGEETGADAGETVVSLFRKQAMRNPEFPAVKVGDCVLTYAQLDEQSNRLAAEIARRGIGRGDCVGVMVGRSKMMPLGALGVLKSGAAYLPMDSSYPADRLEYMLGDAGVRLILADRELAGCVPGFAGEFLYSEEVDTLPEAQSIPPLPQPDDLMVLLYTSGTTGNPKGVMLCHRNLTHFCAWYRRVYQLTETDGVPAYASFGFDACLMDMYPTLTAGAQLYIIPAEMRLDIEGINEYIEKNHITVAFFTTQLGRQFAECMENKSLRALSVGGEALVPLEPPKDFALYNLYGPTECTVLVTRFHVERMYDRVPIGGAIDNTRLYVLDGHDRLAPVGVAGELCIAGRGVAKGYLNRPDLTEEKFTPNPFANEEPYARIYRSGDVVRFLPDGVIDFVGRRDFQIKIRGFRVELTEIEGRIREYPTIANAAVVPMDAPGGGKCAVAYLVSDETVEIEKLNAFIEEVLPPYMVPAATVQVESIPLNPNGKVDRRKLPPPVFGSQQETGGCAQTELGKGIAEVVAGVLGHDGFSATENLLRAGLTSLSAIKLATQIEKRFHVSLSVKSILAECTALALENMVVRTLLTRGPEAGEAQVDLGPVKLEKIDLTKAVEPRELTEDELTGHIHAVIGEVLGNQNVGNTEDLSRAGLNSLSTIKLVTRLKRHFGVAPTVHELLEQATVQTIQQALLRESARKKEQPEEVLEEQAGYPLSGSQLGVYLDCLKRPDALLYHIPVRVALPEGIDAERLKQAAEAVIEAHPILSMRIAGDAEELQQIPLEEPPQVSLLRLTEEELAAHEKTFVQPFDLKRGPLYRVEVIDCGGKIYLLADFHHIAFDGASLDLFLQNLVTAYEGEPIEKEQLSGFHAALLEQRREGSEEWKADQAYFDHCLQNVEGASEIVGDIANPSGRVGSMREAVCVTPRERVEAFCKENGYTPAGLYFAATAYAVSRWTGKDTAALSTVSSGRSDLRLQNSFGMFVRTLPLVLTRQKEQSVRAYITAAQESLRGSMLHEQYPYAQIAADYGFFPSIMYACELGIVSDYFIAGKPMTLTSFQLETPKFHISIHVEERNGNYVFSVAYDDALYSQRLMERFADTLAMALQHMLDAPDAPVHTVSLMSDAERKRIRDFNDTQGEAACGTLHGMFERAATKTPEHCALIAGEDQLSYAALDGCANALAHALIKRGITAEDRVAFLLPRTSRILIAMLGILKAGGCYVPLDPDYPHARVAQIMQDSGAKFLLTTQNHVDLHENAVCVDELPEGMPQTRPQVQVMPEQLAYMIYTSGSTGKPKGVMIEHRGIANYVTATPQNRHVWELVQHAHCMMSITTVTFDMFLKESMTALCNGLTLVLADEDAAHDPVKLAALFEQTGADAFNATPSRMLEYTAYPALLAAIRRCHVVMAGAEKYPPALAERLSGGGSDAKLINTYGPTETTVSCNAKYIVPGAAVTVGAPLMGVHEYVMDADGNELPTSVVGELWIGGCGVARGYLNLPEQTEQQFVQYNGERVYRSGDLARWTAGGEIEILGRSDGQVKLRGLRIEPGEIEEAMRAIDGITQAVADVRLVQGTEQLCAYYTANRPIAAEDVRQTLLETLAVYMVPAAYMQIDAIPLNANGKTNRKALPTPELLRTGEYVAPQDDAERAFCEIFEEVLEVESVGALDDFFAIGGTSLSVTRVVIAAKERALSHADGAPVSYGDVFANANPRALAQLLKDDITQTPVEQQDHFEYDKIDKMLSLNSLQSLREGVGDAVGNVLLTGATGFLGSHMLRELLRESSKIYCLMRKGRLEDVESRLKQMLFYYFDDSFEHEIGSRVIAVEGDITDMKMPALLKTAKIDTVINCAANVSHFAADDSIFRVNAKGVENLVEYCIEVGARLVQISTASIAGFSVDGMPPRSQSMNEQMLYFGQNLENQYVYSKFLAERCILDAAARRGLRAKIMRVGNLMARSADGEFQINADANSFVGNLRAYNVIGCFPYSSYLTTSELAPIDSTTQAISLLMRTPEECRVFHPYNPHTVYLGDLITSMKELGLSIEFVEDDLFIKALGDAMKDKTRAELLTNLVAYQNMAKGKKVLPVSVENNYTTQALLRQNWRWPETGGDYMRRFLKDLIGMGYFDIF